LGHRLSFKREREREKEKKKEREGGNEKDRVGERESKERG
jgi:hypothetical protein